MRKFHSHLILLIILTLAAAVEIGTTGCRGSTDSGDGAGKVAVGGGGNAAIPESDESADDPDAAPEPPGMSAPPVDLPTPITGRIIVTSPDDRGDVFIIGEEGSVAANSVVLIMREAGGGEPLRSLLNLFIRSAHADDPKEFSAICYEPLNKCVRANEFGAFKTSIKGAKPKDRLKIAQILSSGSKDDEEPKIGNSVIKDVPMNMKPYHELNPVGVGLFNNEALILLRGNFSSLGKLRDNAVDRRDAMTLEEIKYSSMKGGKKDATELLLTGSQFVFRDTPGTKSNIYASPLSVIEDFTFFDKGYNKTLPSHSYIGTSLIEAPTNNDDISFEVVLSIGPDGSIVGIPLDFIDDNGNKIIYDFVEFQFSFSQYEKGTVSTKIINRGNCEGEDVVGVIHKVTDADSSKRYVLSLVSSNHFDVDYTKNPGQVKLDTLPIPTHLNNLNNPTDIAFINNDDRCEIVITDSGQKNPKIAIYKYSKTTDNPGKITFELDEATSLGISEYHNVSFQPQEVLISEPVQVKNYNGYLIFVTATDPYRDLYGKNGIDSDIVFTLALSDDDWKIVSANDVGFTPSGMAYQPLPNDHTGALFVTSYDSQTITRIPLEELYP